MMTSLCTRGLLAIAIGIMSWQCYATTVQAFGISTNPFINNGPNTKPCYLDAYRALKLRLDVAVKQNNVTSSTAFVNHFKPQLQQLSADYMCLAHAKALGITKVPAVVFDHKYVVYGMTDLVLANAAYQTYQERHHD